MLCIRCTRCCVCETPKLPGGGMPPNALLSAWSSLFAPRTPSNSSLPPLSDYHFRCDVFLFLLESISERRHSNMTTPSTFKCLFGFDFIDFADEGSDEETPQANNRHHEDSEDQGPAESLGGGGGNYQHGQPPNSSEEEPQRDFLGSNGGNKVIERPSYKPLSRLHDKSASSLSTRSAYATPAVSNASSAISSQHRSIAISDTVGAPSSNAAKNAVSPELGRAMHGAGSRADANELDSFKSYPALYVTQATAQMVGCHAPPNTTATCATGAGIGGTQATQAQHL